MPIQSDRNAPKPIFAAQTGPTCGEKPSRTHARTYAASKHDTYHNVIPYPTVTLHYIALHYIALHYITLHYITYITYVHTIALHSAAFHDITSYITLHYITFPHIHTLTTQVNNPSIPPSTKRTTGSQPPKEECRDLTAER